MDGDTLQMRAARHRRWRDLKHKDGFRWAVSRLADDYEPLRDALAN